MQEIVENSNTHQIRSGSEKQKLYLLEFIVDEIHLSSRNIQKPHCTNNGQTVIQFEFLNLGPFRVCVDDKRSRCQKSNIKSGKSCLFALTPSKADQLRESFVVVCDIYKEVGDQNYYQGTTLVPLVTTFENLSKQMKTDREQQHTQHLKDRVEIQYLDTGEIVGHLEVFIRLSCFNEMLVKPFHCDNNPRIVLDHEDAYYIYMYKRFPVSMQIPCRCKIADTNGHADGQCVRFSFTNNCWRQCPNEFCPCPKKRILGCTKNFLLRFGGHGSNMMAEGPGSQKILIRESKTMKGRSKAKNSRKGQKSKYTTKRGSKQRHSKKGYDKYEKLKNLIDVQQGGIDVVGDSRHLEGLDGMERSKKIGSKQDKDRRFQKDEGGDIRHSYPVEDKLKRNKLSGGMPQKESGEGKVENGGDIKRTKFGGGAGKVDTYHGNVPQKVFTEDAIKTNKPIGHQNGGDLMKRTKFGGHRNTFTRRMHYSEEGLRPKKDYKYSKTNSFLERVHTADNNKQRRTTKKRYLRKPKGFVRSAEEIAKDKKKLEETLRDIARKMKRRENKIRLPLIDYTTDFKKTRSLENLECNNCPKVQCPYSCPRICCPPGRCTPCPPQCIPDKNVTICCQFAPMF